MGHGEGSLFVIKLTVFLRDLPVQLGNGFSRYRQHLHQQGGGIDTVFSRDVAPDSHAAGGFAADDGIRLRHLCGDILEAYGNFVAFLPQVLCYTVQQMGGGIVTDTRTAPSPVFQKVIIQQHQQRVRMEIVAFFIDDAQAVRVAVGGNAQITAVVHHIV